MAFVSICIIEAVLIVALLIYRTRRRQAESALQESEERNRALLKAIPDLMFVISRNGVYLDFHARDLDSLIVPPDRFIGRNMNEIFPAELYVRFAAGIEEAMQSGGPAFVEYSFPVSGAERYFEARIVRRDAETVISIVRDVTEWKLTESALRETRLELAYASRVTTVGELAASIAHEVNQPLCAVVANASACQNWLSQGTTDLQQVREAIHDILRDGRRASDVIARIRNLLRKSPPQKMVLDLNDVIRDVIALARPDLANDGLDVRVDLSSDLPMVEGDRVELQQVMLNLIQNAVEAMIPTQQIRPGILRITSRQMDAVRVEVTVSDTGTGLSPGDDLRIFDPFYTTKSGGMGMGLSISRSIVEAHRGLLWATNNSDAGATFHFSVGASIESTSLIERSAMSTRASNDSIDHPPLARSR